MHAFDPTTIAILGAVPLEIAPLCRILEGSGAADAFELGGEAFRLGTTGRRALLLGTTGIGKVNAAAMTAALLQRFPVREVWNVGCAGAYAGSPLSIGDVIVSERVLLGDEGVLSAGGVYPNSEIGIPVVCRSGHEFYDHLPLNRSSAFQSIREKTPAGLYRLSEGPVLHPALPCDDRSPLEAQASGGGQGTQPGAPPRSRRPGLFRLIYGTSLTVGMVSGDEPTATERFQHYGAFSEDMEGSGVAQTCMRFGVPVLECRGISNFAGDRCKERWRLAQAVAHCHSILLNWLGEP